MHFNTVDTVPYSIIILIPIIRGIKRRVTGKKEEITHVN